MKRFIPVIIILTFLNVASFGQSKFVGYMVDNEENKLKDVSITLYNGNVEISTKRFSKSFEFDLKLEAYYTLELSKEGFVSKKIAISTFEGDKTAEPFMFVMQLEGAVEGQEHEDGDFPSALIKYKRDEGVYNFDVDYAKNLKRAAKEAKKKNKKD